MTLFIQLSRKKQKKLFSDERNWQALTFETGELRKQGKVEQVVRAVHEGNK
jgi:hypothetical protein